VRCYVDCLNCLFERKSMRDKLRQGESVAITVEYEVCDLIEKSERGRVRAHQGLLVHTNDPGIKSGVAALSLSEEHHLSAAARRVHCRFDQRISTDGEDDCVGSATISLLKDAFYVAFAACVNGILEPVLGCNGMALGIEV